MLFLYKGFLIQGPPAHGSFPLPPPDLPGGEFTPMSPGGRAPHPFEGVSAPSPWTPMGGLGVWTLFRGVRPTWAPMGGLGVPHWGPFRGIRPPHSLDTHGERRGIHLGPFFGGSATPPAWTPIGSLGIPPWNSFWRVRPPWTPMGRKEIRPGTYGGYAGTYPVQHHLHRR